MTDTIDITDDRAIFNGGQFDTDNRYLRTTASGAVTTMLAGPSLAVDFDGSLISFRYECGAYVLTGQSFSGPTAPTSVANTPSEIAL